MQPGDAALPPEFVAHIEAKLRELKEGHCGASLVFPATLCSAERKYIHLAAKQAQLTSCSSGEGKERRIEVFRDGAPEPEPVSQQQAEASREERLSKMLSSVLRHRAEELGLKIRPDGFVRLCDVVALPCFQRFTCGPQEIQDLAANCAKQRFSVTEDQGETWIRANQGHTISRVHDIALLIPIKNPEDLHTCIHGTYFIRWTSILEEGLRCMGRNHIHFVTREPGEEVMSGMRQDVQVALYIDAQRALADGCEFFTSANGVVLSRGFGGCLPPKYFLRAVQLVECFDRAAGSLLFPQEASGGAPARSGGAASGAAPSSNAACPAAAPAAGSRRGADRAPTAGRREAADADGASSSDEETLLFGAPLVQS